MEAASAATASKDAGGEEPQPSDPPSPHRAPDDYYMARARELKARRQAASEAAVLEAVSVGAEGRLLEASSLGLGAAPIEAGGFDDDELSVASSHESDYGELELAGL